MFVGAMDPTSGAAVVIIGGGVTGLSTGWWLVSEGVDVLVLEKGIVGWEASGRNGGGATHVYSPFGLEEQRLSPQMDELLADPTEYRPGGSSSIAGSSRNWCGSLATTRSVARTCTSAATRTRSARCKPGRGEASALSQVGVFPDECAEPELSTARWTGQPGPDQAAHARGHGPPSEPPLP